MKIPRDRGSSCFASLFWRGKLSPEVHPTCPAEHPQVLLATLHSREIWGSEDGEFSASVEGGRPAARSGRAGVQKTRLLQHLGA